MHTPDPARRAALSGAAAWLATAALPGLALAQAKYPSKPVRIIVGLPAGGTADSSVRMLAATMLPSLGQTIIVDNKPGANFQIAVHALTQAPADGYTLLHVINAMLSGQAVQKRYDLFKSLVPIAMTGSSDITFVVGAKSPHKTVQDLIAWATAHPGKLTYASPGTGSLEHLALSNLCKRYGIDAVHVPFKGGPEMVQAVGSGEADLSTAAVPLVVQFAPKNLIRALVVLNDKRNAAIPDVPSLPEAKLDLAKLVIWSGLAAPAGTPQPVLELLERQVLAAADNPELRRQYLAMGLAPAPAGAAAFGQVWKDDWAWIAKAASEAKLDTN